jgi:DNA-binding transcriptional MerR regulator
MNKTSFHENYSLASVSIEVVEPRAYSLEATARLANVHPEMLRYYCQLGLFGEARTQSDVELIFDDDSVYELRRFEHYRQHHNVNRRTLRLMCSLWHEVERLKMELRFLRGT